MRRVLLGLAVAASVLAPMPAKAVWIEGTTRAVESGRTWLVPATVQVTEDRTGKVLVTTTADRWLWLGIWVQGYAAAAPDRTHLTIRAFWRDPRSGRLYEGVARRAVYGVGGRAVVNLNLIRR